MLPRVDGFQQEIEMQETRKKSEAEQLDFFNQTLAAFEQACDAVGAEDHFFDVAGTTVCLRFAGSRLVSVMVRALEHLRLAGPCEAQITVCVWDSTTTGIEMPRIECNWDCFTNRGDIWGFNSQRIRTAFHWVGKLAEPDGHGAQHRDLGGSTAPISCRSGFMPRRCARSFTGAWRPAANS